MSIPRHLYFINIVTTLYTFITFTTSQQTIGCGQTVEGIRTRNQAITLQFTSTASYSQVYLEGCLSTHDITLEVQNFDGITIANEAFNHGLPQSECGHRSAGDVTIPTPVTADETFTFMIRGRERSRNRSGFYSVTLFCTNSPISSTTTRNAERPSSTSSTTSSSTTSSTSSTSSTEPVIASIECGETVTGNRASEQEISLVFTSTARYDEVYLEGCSSTHDIWLEIQRFGITVADVDDQFNHGVPQNECGHRFAGDITIPHTVSSGDVYIFIVKGYRTAAGMYSVTLFCDQQTV